MQIVMRILNKLGPTLSRFLVSALLSVYVGVAVLCALTHRYLAGSGFALAAGSTWLTMNVVWHWWPRAAYLMRQRLIVEVLSTRMEHIPDGIEGIHAWIRTVAGNAGMHARFEPGPDGTPDQALVLTDADGGVIGVKRA